MASVFDTFSTDQMAGTIAYAGTWWPISSRTLTVTSGNILTTTGFLSMFSLGGSMNVQLSYNFPSPIDLTSLSSITLSGVGFGTANTVTLQVRADATLVGSINFSSAGNYDVPVSIASSAVSTLSFSFTSGDVSLSIDNTYSTIVCVAHNSEIKTKTGTILVQNLRRGDEIEGGRVALLIRNKLEKDARVEVVSLTKDSLQPGLPNKDTIVCADHYLIYKGKRRLARSLIAFPGVKLEKGKVSSLLPHDEEGNYYFYDVQFEEESFYVVNGLMSQSRSPYALVSPLAKELYYDPSRYREDRVKNTLTQEPEITFLYLLPDGREVESFLYIKNKE